jgi:hypothetical protein
MTFERGRMGLTRRTSSIFSLSPVDWAGEKKGSESRTASSSPDVSQLPSVIGGHFTFDDSVFGLVLMYKSGDTHVPQSSQCRVPSARR